MRSTLSGITYGECLALKGNTASPCVEVYVQKAYFEIPVAMASIRSCAEHWIKVTHSHCP